MKLVLALGDNSFWKQLYFLQSYELAHRRSSQIFINFQVFNGTLLKLCPKCQVIDGMGHFKQIARSICIINATQP